jgi:hypothetical protein
MTRTSIEACAKIFIVALACVFIWAVKNVLATMGVL